MFTTSVSLLERVRQPADQAAWGRFVRLDAPRSHGWARRAGLDAAAAALIRQLETLPPAGADAATWPAPPTTAASTCCAALTRPAVRPPGSEGPMDRHTIERSCPYTFGAVGLGCAWLLAFAFGLGAAAAVCVACGGRLPDAPPRDGPPDTALLGLAALFFAGLAAAAAWFARRMGRGQNRRIAFTPDGLLLPRHRFAAEEEFVPYADVRHWHFEQYRGEVTFLTFFTPAGQFAIARQKLWKRDFDAVCTAFLAGVREAQGVRLPPQAGAATRAEDAPAARPACPGCAAPLAGPAAVICLACGFDRRTGRRLPRGAVRRPPAADGGAGAAAYDDSPPAVPPDRHLPALLGAAPTPCWRTCRRTPPRRASHRRGTGSRPEVASRAPSGLNATLNIPFVCPFNSARGWHGGRPTTGRFGPRRPWRGGCRRG